MVHDDFGGLHRDLWRTGRAIKRRDLLKLGTSGLSALYLFRCALNDPQGDEPDDSTCERIREETAGPFPGDGTNGPNVLNQAGVVRSDIRPSFGGLQGTAEGVPLTVTLRLVRLQDDCALAEGRAVYVWHCDREARYSLYNDGAKDQNYLRGVQVSGADGQLSFTTIFPGAYRGRWPHIHFEVFPSLESASNARNKIATSQLAFPEDVCNEVYATSGYQSSAAIMSRLSLARDGVFRDGVETQMATMTGSVSKGFVAKLTVAT